MVWYPNLTIVYSKFMFKLLFFLYHYVPAFFADIVLRFKGSKLSVVKIYSKIYYYIGLYNYFTDHSWVFSNDNMKQIFSRMSEEDHEEFPCTATADDFAPYVSNNMNGLRKYFFKETDEDLTAARRKYLCFKIVNNVIWGCLYTYVAYFLLPHAVNFRNVANEYFKIHF